MEIKKLEDLIGKKFGRLLVLNETEKRKGNIFYKCSCECGNKKWILKYNLLNGKTTSCGCHHKEVMLIFNSKKKKYNNYDLSGKFGKGLTFNTKKEFYFDLEDYEKIKNHCWSENKNGYIYNSLHKIRQHRLIMNATDKKNMEIDHKNNQKHDNRKENLRYATRQNNLMNRGANSNNKLGIKGVYKSNKKYSASIRVNGHIIYLGSFVNLQDAINTRKQKEQELFGEFAYKGEEILK